MQRTFYFNITFQCNNNCLFCAADYQLNNNQSAISYEDFGRILSTFSIGHGDIIVLNGGEPTVHPYFSDFVKLSKHAGAYVDLFTNGKKLANLQFCERIIDSCRMKIRIPMFGSQEQQHDRLTGFPGNFKAAWDAIDNILLAKKRGFAVDLDIKLLLSKATSKDNFEIAKQIVERCKGIKNYVISLNMLLLSNSVKKNSGIMMEQYYESVNNSISIIDYVLNMNGLINYESLPMCLLPERLRIKPQNKTTNSKFYYFDPYCIQGHLIEEKVKTICTACLRCKYINTCRTIPANYLDYYGEKEFVPLD